MNRISRIRNILLTTKIQIINHIKYLIILIVNKVL